VSAVAVPLVLLGALTCLGTLVTVLVAPRTPPDIVPVWCRGRLAGFGARGGMLMGSAAGLAVVGGVLLVGWP
jgi:hypothetical protein